MRRDTGGVRALPSIIPRRVESAYSSSDTHFESAVEGCVLGKRFRRFVLDSGAGAKLDLTPDGEQVLTGGF